MFDNFKKTNSHSWNSFLSINSHLDTDPLCLNWRLKNKHWPLSHNLNFGLNFPVNKVKTKILSWKFGYIIDRKMKLLSKIIEKWKDSPFWLKILGNGPQDSWPRILFWKLRVNSETTWQRKMVQIFGQISFLADQTLIEFWTLLRRVFYVPPINQDKI